MISFTSPNSESAYRESTRKSGISSRVGQRRCKKCGQHKNIKGGTILAKGREFICAECK